MVRLIRCGCDDIMNINDFSSVAVIILDEARGGPAVAGSDVAVVGPDVKRNPIMVCYIENIIIARRIFSINGSGGALLAPKKLIVLIAVLFIIVAPMEDFEDRRGHVPVHICRAGLALIDNAVVAAFGVTMLTIGAAAFTVGALSLVHGFRMRAVHS